MMYWRCRFTPAVFEATNVLTLMIPKLHWIGISCRKCEALRQIKQANDSGQVDSVEIFVVWIFDIRFETTWVVLMLAAVIRYV